MRLLEDLFIIQRLPAWGKNTRGVRRRGCRRCTSSIQGSQGVDVVVELDDGGVLAFEVKANERIRDADLDGLRKLRDILGERLLAGFAFSTGPHSYTLEGERLHVMPIDRMWRPVA